ncbi:Protein Asterix [Platanthera guangdongensis]|uniref:Protein Asterix n=1 Tax=Platanthera guangdongensis TaxID=2320717 RepID=A0ABR2MJ87_9ASPA
MGLNVWFLLFVAHLIIHIEYLGSHGQIFAGAVSDFYKLCSWLAIIFCAQSLVNMRNFESDLKQISMAMILLVTLLLSLWERKRTKTACGHHSASVPQILLEKRTKVGGSKSCFIIDDTIM